MKIFHRIDDIGEYNEKYVEILEFFETNCREFIVAAIPAKFSKEYTDVLSSCHSGVIYQHGYEHLNRVPYGWCDEFPDSMSKIKKRELLKRGKDKLEYIMDSEIYGYVPPWNNTGSETIAILKKMGYRVYSAQKNNTIIFNHNKDICVDIVNCYNPEIEYKDLEILYKKICAMQGEQDEIGIMYHFMNPSDKYLEMIYKFIKRVEKLNEKHI